MGKKVTVEFLQDFAGSENFAGIKKGDVRDIDRQEAVSLHYREIVKLVDPSQFDDTLQKEEKSELKTKEEKSVKKTK